MALFQFLVQKIGLPVLAYFAITKGLEAWKDQKLGKLSDCVDWWISLLLYGRSTSSFEGYSSILEVVTKYF